MLTRTQTTPLVFWHSFPLKCAGGLQPAGTYTVETEEELFESLSFPIYRRVLTTITRQAVRAGAFVQALPVGPWEMAEAHAADRFWCGDPRRRTTIWSNISRRHLHDIFSADKELQSMPPVRPKPIAVRPRCDGRRVLFELVDEGRSVPCAISLGALEDVSERRCSRPADQISAFAAAHQLIGAIALSKIRAQAQDAPGLLNIWSSDVEKASAVSEAAAGRPA